MKKILGVIEIPQQIRNMNHLTDCFEKILMSGDNKLAASLAAVIEENAKNIKESLLKSE